MNALAGREFANRLMSQMAPRLVSLQRKHEQSACALTDADVKFTLKQCSTQHTLREWSPQIKAHIAGHVLRLKRTLKRGRRPTRHSAVPPGQ